MAKKKTVPGIEVLELDYSLAELPSSQHRAGLAGLVLMVRWLKRQGAHKGICEIIRLDEGSTTLRINQEGLIARFDEVYAASMAEVEESKPRTKGKTKEVVPPIKEVIRDVIKRGKDETQTFYIYPVVVPRGAFLVDLDPSASGDKGIWIKLW